MGHLLSALLAFGSNGVYVIRQVAGSKSRDFDDDSDFADLLVHGAILYCGCFDSHKSEPRNILAKIYTLLQCRNVVLRRSDRLQRRGVSFVIPSAFQTFGAVGRKIYAKNIQIR